MYHICFSVTEVVQGERKAASYDYEVLSHGVRVAKGGVDVVLLDGYLPPMHGVARMCVTAQRFFVALMDKEEMKFWVSSIRDLERVAPDEGKKYRVLYVWEAEMSCVCGCEG